MTRREHIFMQLLSSYELLHYRSLKLLQGQSFRYVADLIAGRFIVRLQIKADGRHYAYSLALGTYGKQAYFQFCRNI
jgi:hypothetical protein